MYAALMARVFDEDVGCEELGVDVVIILLWRRPEAGDCAGNFGCL